MLHFLNKYNVQQDSIDQEVLTLEMELEAIMVHVLLDHIVLLEQINQYYVLQECIEQQQGFKFQVEAVLQDTIA